MTVAEMIEELQDMPQTLKFEWRTSRITRCSQPSRVSLIALR